MNAVRKRTVTPVARTGGGRVAAAARTVSASASLSALPVSIDSSSRPSKSSASSTTPCASAVPARRRTQTCHLIRIPPELRLKIFGYAVVDPVLIEPEVVETSMRIKRLDGGNRTNEFKEVEESEESELEEPHETKRSFMSLRSERNGLALARTCSFIRNEVLPIYFGGNTFRFTRTKELYFYLTAASPYVQSLIKKITFIWDGPPVYSAHAFRALKYLTSLESLTIIVASSTINSANLESPELNDIWQAHGIEVLRTLRVADPSRFKLLVSNGKIQLDLASNYKSMSERGSYLRHPTPQFFVDELLEQFTKKLSAEITEESVTVQGFMLATGGPFGKARQSERMIEKERKGDDGRHMATRKY